MDGCSTRYLNLIANIIETNLLLIERGHVRQGVGGISEVVIELRQLAVDEDLGDPDEYSDD